MKYKLEATVPVVQYGNIKPVFEIESESDEAEVLTTLQRLWNRFGESPLKDKSGSGVEVQTFTGETILWNEETHTYTDHDGNVLLSGSKYADQHSPKFDMDVMLPKTAKSWDVNEKTLSAIWKENGDLSNHWGSAIHKALEIYHKYSEVGSKIQEKKEMEENYILPKNKFLRGIVTEFVEKFGANALSEVVVSDVKNKMAGTIDRLELVADNTYRIGDYKTNAEMDSKKKLKYQKQLSFYAHILINKGFNVQGLDLYYLDQENGWVKDELEILPLE